MDWKMKVAVYELQEDLKAMKANQMRLEKMFSALAIGSFFAVVIFGLMVF